jgi:hypothetical protein
MVSSRKIIAEFLGVFLIGAVTGGLVESTFSTRKIDQFMSRTNNPSVMVALVQKRYANDFKFTPDEIAKTQPLTSDMIKEIFRVRHRFGVDMLGTLDKYHAEIAAQLTPEHRAIYEQKMADRRKELAALLLLDRDESESP